MNLSFMKIGYVHFLINSLKYIVQLKNKELVQVATCTGPKFVHVATCTSQPVQVTTCTSCNLYRFLVQVATCTKSQLVHNIYILTAFF